MQHPRFSVRLLQKLFRSSTTPLHPLSSRNKRWPFSTNISSKLDLFKGGKTSGNTPAAPTGTWANRVSSGLSQVSTQQASSTDYNKLARPMPSTLPTRALNAVPVNAPRAPSAMRSGYGAPSKSLLRQGERYTDDWHSWYEYEVGTIISFATHEHHYDQAAEEGEGDVSITNVGVVNSKFRKHIVVRRCTDHVIALPIFTHHGNGLSRKRNKHEYISVRDLDNKEQAAGPETEHGILWAEVYPGFKKEGMSAWHRMSDVTSIQFTRPQVHMIDRKSTITGQLHPESRSKLKALFLKAMDEAGIDGPVRGTPVIRTQPADSTVGTRFQNLESNGSSAPKELFPSGAPSSRRKVAASTTYLSSRSRVQGRGPSDVYAPRR